MNRRPGIRRAWMAAVIGAMVLGGTARAAEIEGVQFPDEHQVRGVRMSLAGTGLLRYKMFFRAYVAALYLGEGVAAQDVFEDVPKRIELRYFWSIDGADFGPAGDQVLAKNVDADTFATLRPRLEELNAAYEDVRPGDRYALTYVPGVGTELTLNGAVKALIPGADFAASYFRIWLGEQPIDRAMRDQLLDRRGNAEANRQPGDGHREGGPADS